jgi:hypothetical protein
MPEASNRFPNRRALLAGCAALAVFSPLAACADEASAHIIDVRRDAGCGCCHAWTRQLANSGLFETSLTDEADMPALKRRLGVPDDLASCHTATVGGFVIEGHVPMEDLLRLLAERPSITGLAVPGMPLGSPGMEHPDGVRESFDVIAFGGAGERTVYAHHGA